jgi:uncharacterized CHY-type Zn-finger protein
MRVVVLTTIVLIMTAVAVTATAQVTADRIAVLEDQHGYYPCMDCHGDQESIATPRILEEEHGEPLEWEDDEGNVHLVPFGRLVALADLLDQTGDGDMASVNLGRIGARLDITSYMEMNELAPTDSVWTLVHGGGNLWCLNCHNDEDRDKLTRTDGELLTFNQSQFLCGGCHGPKLRDWEAGIHGKITGYWDPAQGDEEATVKMLCVECHLAHDPAFPSYEPMPGPIVRVDGPGRKKADH